tara:strand:+ start:667 stop:1668 length:1002 start_codon:yes stop_codon:yes gene_type:complete
MPYLGSSPARGLVGSSHIDDLAITTSKIAAAAVTSAKTSGLPADKDIRALALEVSDVKGAALNFNNGAADPFDSDTLATKTNATYSADDDYYHNPDAEDLVSDDSTTWATASAMLSGGTTNRNPEALGNGSNTGAWTLQVDFGSGNEQDIIKAGFQYGGYSGTRTGSWQHSDNGSSWTDAATFNFTQSADYYQSFSSAGAHRYWRLNLTAYSGSTYTAILWVRFYRQLTTDNMTLISNALTASSAPSTGFITVQADPVDSVTVNTDLKAFISRDGGSNYSEVTLAAGATNSNFINYEGSVDISSQPSGTSMKYKVTTHNNKEIRVSGVVLRWA